MISAALQSACDNAIRTTRRGDTRSGIGLARHAYRLARQESEAAEVVALNALGLCQTANGAFIEGLATAIDAYQLAEKIEDRRGAVFALSTIGAAASFILNAHDFLLEMLAACLADADALDDAALQARVQIGIGLVYLDMGDFAKGDAAYSQALALVEGAGEFAALITPAYLVIGNMAALAVRRFRSDVTATGADHESVAEARAAQFLDAARAEGNIDAEARAYFTFGQLRAAQRCPAEAQAAFAESIARATRIKHFPRLVDAYMEVAKLHAEAARHEEAIEVLEIAADIADSNRPSGKIPEIYSQIAGSYDALKRTRDAAHYRAKSGREREIFDRENASAIRNLYQFWRRSTAAAGDKP